MIPFYLFYSMFGFQRVGDLLWALADARGRGFLLGCTAGRTTLNGEGLQHQDGHSLLLASTVPSVAAYDPAFSYEVAAIVEDGIHRMTGPDAEDRYWYLTLYNESYAMPALPPDPAEAERVRIGTIRGLYRFGEGVKDRSATPSEPLQATLVFSGSMWREAVEAQRLLAEEWGVDAEVWSATSYKSLREDAISVERWNRLHPGQPQRQPFVTELLAQSGGPIVAVTDFMRSVPDQVARWMPRRFISLGTDGFGRSDTREVLRRHFEIDAAHLVVAVLSGLAADGSVPAAMVAEAIGRYDIDGELADPWSG
jgi:pyruvate dehydrogenase E1 component